MSKNPADLLDWVHRFRNYGKRETHLTVCQWKKQGDVHIAIYCALIPDALIEESLSQVGWDIWAGDGGPTPSVGPTGYGYTSNGLAPIEPLVFKRDFYGIYPDYVEVSEEFRLYFNLYHSRAEQKFIWIDQGGVKHDAVIYTTFEKDDYLSVKISRKLLDEYCLVKNVHLAIFFQIDRELEPNFEKPSTSLKDTQYYKENLLHAKQFYWQVSCDKWRSRLMGKRLFPGRDRTDRRPWLFYNDSQEFEEFIIGIDDNGQEKKTTCNPQIIQQNGLGFYQRVYFRKEVLTKYYDNPDRYEVQDGILFDGNLWSLRMDNDHPDHVSVFLGDLGRSLGHSEQLHWRIHNFWPSNPGLSTTAYRRTVLGEFANPNSLEHRFKAQFVRFNEDYLASQGHELFPLLHENDKYILRGLTVPFTDAPSDFDKQILLLCKLLVDSLSENEIDRRIRDSSDTTKASTKLKGEGKTIQKLEELLTLLDAPNSREHLEILRDIQSCRSAFAAHRKAGHYKKIVKKLNIDELGTKTVFEQLLQRSIDLLVYLRENIC